MTAKLTLLCAVLLAGCGAPLDDQVDDSEAALLGGGEPADRIDGLPGSYLRFAAPPGTMSSMSLGAMFHGDGAYSRRVACASFICPSETGNYHALPTNPAVGWSFIAFLPDHGTPSSYIIERLWRGPLGDTIQKLQLTRADGTAAERSFLMYRVGP